MVHQTQHRSVYFYPPPSLPSLQTDFGSDTSSSNIDAFSPRTLYASFHRPDSSATMPPRTYKKKNMGEFTGFGITTEEEFEALPIAVRRKYFSTLERLRFASNPHSTDLPIQHHRKLSLAEPRGSVGPVEGGIRPRPLSRKLRNPPRQRTASTNETSWFLTRPEKTQRKRLTQEELVNFDRRRTSVILDAADEAIYRASRRASQNLSPLRSNTISTNRSSMEQTLHDEKDTKRVDSIYDSFRWMDSETELDLSLAPFDNYHANLDGVVIPTPESTRRPSFRRQISISALPFGRSSLQSAASESPKTNNPTNFHNRQRSRALSLINPKHIPQASVSSIDPNAAHYQDPEARLKLRVYLASPQKFDEAIEFGFPSMDEKAGADDKENRAPGRRSKDQSRRPSMQDKNRSFLNDDTVSLFPDDKSEVDSDTPLTPLEIDCGYRPHSRTVSQPQSSRGKNSVDYSHLGITKPMVVKSPDPYAQALAGSREMTLRMTLTRPDLRADESVIYGSPPPVKSSPREKPMSLDLEEKDECRGPFGGTDGWGPPNEKDGVVKRLWQRVKSSQRKST